ncbi:protein of unknown function DUF1080 [Pseudopedobacter saltans DSM 12145]|uniref:3-keto-alpha-glucoside-1,2-lyase/3-keto-2-hydroxy-glucal hydratase domain-containing protein n=1 Tax=Pseudopedobacter saltans (strain ATCC 51119 / DSM 12145 / JCM 21818 / CCUG 39354 / LMG 10337 / NBRC 100064 / NCIMB 13643) TaxID=762903 RepID=F0S748_PSESL|nr:DUF1080 domain-containing protein [Pseudopedobacter saltans]ADY54321.1 protein of unknown function DUF1080 [Pseudopedobacter saltans DSM 12145]
MKNFLFLLSMIFVTSSCSAQKTNSQWENLSSPDKWHTYGKNEVTKAWQFENGVLYFNSKITDKSQKGNLITNEAFENFHLQLEWKISQKGNSGVIFLVNEDISKYKEPYLTGPEMQVLDNDGHPDGKIFKHRAGDLYDLTPCKRETVKPVGEWNKAEIILKNAKLTFILNGEKVVETTMWDDAWNKMVAESKFKAMPDFAKYKQGKIALQDHGNDVWYRNIRIKRL